MLYCWGVTERYNCGRKFVKAMHSERLRRLEFVFHLYLKGRGKVGFIFGIFRRLGYRMGVFVFLVLSGVFSWLWCCFFCVFFQTKSTLSKPQNLHLAIVITHDLIYPSSSQNLPMSYLRKIVYHQ